MSLLIKREDQEPINLDLLDAAANELPPIWNGPHVGLRITEGFVTFRAMPLGGSPGGAASAWPPYMYEFDDLVAQKKQGELERTMATQNRTRVSPSMRDITRAIEVSYWPMKYLLSKPELCEAVNALALAHALDRDAGWVTRKRGGYADTWRARHDQGCEIIARRLIKDRVWVF